MESVEKLIAFNNMVRQSILKTLHYFDLVQFPLTKEELFAYLWQPSDVDFGDFLTVLADLEQQKAIEQKCGYYFLSGNEKSVAWRRERLLVTEKKMRIAMRAAKKIRSVPFLKAIFVCNTVGAEQSVEDSDIDFLIITHPKRIWIVRFLTNFILRLWRLRTYGKRIKNRICLSFYLDAHHLSLSNYRIAEDDIHLAYWLYQMLPIYDPGNLYPKFLQANSWSRKFLPNLEKRPVFTERLIVADSKLGHTWKRIWEKMWGGIYGDIIEKQSRLIQWMKLKSEIKNKVNRGDKGVIISDGIIKFHEQDARANYRQEWMKRTQKFG